MKLLILLFLLVPQLSAQNLAVPQPAEILGYELGSRFTSHANIERYALALQSAVPGRVQVVPYGSTYEHRSLYLVVIGSPENMRELDRVKSDIRRLSDPRGVSDTDAGEIIKRSPAIAWLSYGVHGNEASSPEAALNVMYLLASYTDPDVRATLENVIVVIDPNLNPDGHERYVNFQVSRRGIRPNEEKAAVEHNEDSPSGRTNHYFFDLNRDWAWLTQKESRARVKAYREWKPQVHVDFHEMSYNSSYFFFPAFKPINKNFPASTVEWGNIFGKANAAAFDARGWSYWSGESFDLFYPGYGDSWPSLNGAIGMTYEQAGQVGVRVRRSDETILTLKDRLDHHSATSIATLKATSDNREKLLRDFYHFHTEALAEARTGRVRAYIVDPTTDPSLAVKMADLLLQQGVELYRVTDQFTSGDLSTHFSTAKLSKTFPPGSFIIPLEQPAKRLITALMEQEPVLSDTFFYDITTWSLPVAYGVPVYWTGKIPAVAMTKVESVERPTGTVVGGKAAYAYVFRWNSADAVRALAMLLQNGYVARVAMRDFVMNGERFGRGSVIVPVHGNDDSVHSAMRDIAAGLHIDVFAAKSGYTESGINLGSDKAVRMKKPKILVVTGAPVGAESFGAIWSMFDVQYGIDFVPVKLAQLRGMDLHDYTAMIFPDDYGGGNGYRGHLDSSAVQKIKTWIAAGGTFIGIEGGAAFASASVGKIASVKLKEKKKDEEKGKSEKKDSEKKDEPLSEEELMKRMTVEEREKKERLETIPGTMLRVRLDTSHPLGFGYDREITVLKTTNTMYELTSRGYNVGIYSKLPRLSGYISKENEKLLEETPFLIHEQLGSGNIVLFADDPNFRLFWDGLNKLFLNSVLLMPSMRNIMLSTEGQ